MIALSRILGDANPEGEVLSRRNRWEDEEDEWDDEDW